MMVLQTVQRRVTEPIFFQEVKFKILKKNFFLFNAEKSLEKQSREV